MPTKRITRPLSASGLSTLSLLSIGSTTAFAHGGHDHGHWMSDAIHVLLFLAMAGVVASGVSLLLRRRHKEKR